MMPFHWKINNTTKPMHTALMVVLLAATVLLTTGFTLTPKKNMNMKIGDWKTWCMGCFVVSVPPNAEYHERHFRYDYSEISVTPMEPAEFQAMLHNRREELKAIKHDSEPNYLLGASTIKDVPLSGLLTYYKSDSEKFLITLEAYKLIDGLSFELVTNESPDRMSTAQNIVSDEMESIVKRGAREMPTVPGFCFENGFIPDNGNKHTFYSSGFTFSEYPDVILKIDINDNDDKVEQTTLLQNVDRNLTDPGVDHKGLTILRRGNRQIGDMPGQEILIRSKNGASDMSVLYRWETNGRPNDSTHPSVGIELWTTNRFSNSGRQPASLTEKEAMVLWDQILNTFKLRPVVISEQHKVPPKTNPGSNFSPSHQGKYVK